VAAHRTAIQSELHHVEAIRRHRRASAHLLRRNHTRWAIAAPDGSFDFFSFDPAYLSAVAADWGDTFPTAFHEAFGTTAPRTTFDTVLMGRGTFEPAIHAGIADPYAHLDTFVYSSSLDPSRYPQVTIVSDDPIAHVRELKQADGGGIWLCGGGRLAASLAAEVDRLVLKLNPVTVGDGIPLFSGAFALDTGDSSPAAPTTQALCCSSTRRSVDEAPPRTSKEGMRRPRPATAQPPPAGRSGP
jgi:dihydrofolate reductase